MKPRLTQLEVSALLAGSDFDGPPRQWRRCREIFNAFIADGDTVLDAGCANGLLLASLLVWRERPFIPYGFDCDPMRIAEAKALLRPFQDHFWVADFRAPDWSAPPVDVIISPLPVEASYDTRLAFMDRCVALARRNALFHLYEDEMHFASIIEDLAARANYSFKVTVNQTKETLVVECPGAAVG